MGVQKPWVLRESGSEKKKTKKQQGPKSTCVCTDLSSVSLLECIQKTVLCLILFSTIEVRFHSLAWLGRTLRGDFPANGNREHRHWSWWHKVVREWKGMKERNVIENSHGHRFWSVCRHRAQCAVVRMIVQRETHREVLFFCLFFFWKEQFIESFNSWRDGGGGRFLNASLSSDIEIQMWEPGFWKDSYLISFWFYQ